MYPRLRQVLKPKLWPGFTSGIQVLLCIVPALIMLLAGLLITRVLFADQVAGEDIRHNELITEIAGLTQELHAGITGSDALGQRLTSHAGCRTRLPLWQRAGLAAGQYQREGKCCRSAGRHDVFGGSCRRTQAVDNRSARRNALSHGICCGLVGSRAWRESGAFTRVTGP